MRLQALKKAFYSALSAQYPQSEIQSFFHLLAEFKLNLTRVEVALQRDFLPKKQDLDFFKQAIQKLQNHLPIQYIIGSTQFYGLPFTVNKNVLIPRPETEELVQWIVNDFKKTTNPLKILDIGTGSGCIAIALAKNLPNATIFAIDISSEAIKTAKENAKINNVTIHFIEADILKLSSLKNVFAKETKQPNINHAITSANPHLCNNEKLGTFDIIVSNPPYVRELEKTQIKANVLKNEPHVALFVENDNPLLFYDKISDFAKKQLQKNGALYFEINQYLGEEMVNLLASKAYQNIELKKDIYGANRMLKASNTF